MVAVSLVAMWLATASAAHSRTNFTSVDFQAEAMLSRLESLVLERERAVTPYNRDFSCANLDTESSLDAGTVDRGDYMKCLTLFIAESLGCALDASQQNQFSLGTQGWERLHPEGLVPPTCSK